MYTGNIFDRLMQRFQHRWETDRQWRAMMGGALALFALVALCGTVTGVAAAANQVLGPAGLGLVDIGQPAQSDGTPDTGARLVNGVLTFPTPTAVWTVGAIPALSPIPNSQTPIPKATAAQPTPTPSPTPTNTGGGGGSLNCSGSGGGISYALSPCPQIHGQNGTLTIQGQKRDAGATLNIVLQLGSCSGCGKLFMPEQGYRLDGNGYIAITYSIPADAATGQPITGMINLSTGGGTTIQASPVQ
ncbi:MAG TPA: hypothetical protein VFY89_03330 [Ktedonobacterales bacterium]